MASMVEAPAWRGGWYRFARPRLSPNFGSRPVDAAIDLIVIHSISLPPGRYGGDEVQQLFLNQLDWDADPYFQAIRGIEVSAHFYVQRDGSLWQFVSCDDRAWHAGASSWRGRENCNVGPFGRPSGCAAVGLLQVRAAALIPFGDRLRRPCASLARGPRAGVAVP